MAYFANGCEGDYYYERYCMRCANMRDRGNGVETCPVWDIHLDWNYDAVGDGADKTKAKALDALWPSDGIHNGECALFVVKAAEAAGGTDG